VPTATVYLYRIPASVHGHWQASVPPELTRQRVALDLRQQWQKLDGMASVGGREVPLAEVALRGDRVAFALPVERGRIATFAGRAQGDAIEGTLTLDGVAFPWKAARMR